MRGSISLQNARKTNGLESICAAVVVAVATVVVAAVAASNLLRRLVVTSMIVFLAPLPGSAAVRLTVFQRAFASACVCLGPPLFRSLLSAAVLVAEAHGGISYQRQRPQYQPR